MKTLESLDELANNVYSLDRDQCVSELQNLPRLRLDFTDEFLAGLSLDRLRHVLMAACIQAQKPFRG